MVQRRQNLREKWYERNGTIVEEIGCEEERLLSRAQEVGEMVEGGRDEDGVAEIKLSWCNLEGGSPRDN
jgi:hypothetical protein